MMKPIYLVFFFTVFLGLISSCAKIKKSTSQEIEDLKDESGNSSIKPNWFQNSPERFQLKNINSETSPHLFFDINPLIDIKNKTLRYVIETPRQSESQYKLDLKSGQHYFDRLYCKESDPIGKGLSVYKPPFHIGIVPKVYDQLGTPQKIYVFSEDKGENFKTKDYPARVVGGFVESVCASGRCTKRDHWSSRLILIAVDGKSSKFKNVNSIDELKRKVNWSESLDFFRFGAGSNLVGQEFIPSAKIGVMLPVDKVLNYFQKKSLFFNIAKMTRLKSSCYKLYDQIWRELGQDSKLEKELRASSDLKERVKIVNEMNKNRFNLYNRRFQRTFSKYHSHYLQCEKLIYPMNINKNFERFWYFSYYSIVNLLYKENYFFDCRKNRWIFNSLKRDGTRIATVENAFKGCSIRKIERSFKKGLVLLNNLRSKAQDSYRFIEYDNSAYGTHQKLFSWVKIPSKRFQCSKGKEFFLKVNLFPKDVKLKKRDFEFFRQTKVIF